MFSSGKGHYQVSDFHEVTRSNHRAEDVFPRAYGSFASAPPATSSSSSEGLNQIYRRAPNSNNCCTRAQSLATFSATPCAKCALSFNLHNLRLYRVGKINNESVCEYKGERGRRGRAQCALKLDSRSRANPSLLPGVKLAGDNTYFQTENFTRTKT